MRVGFAGTPEFAALALAALHESGYTIPLVLTQPDRPSGRGMAVTPSAVKRLALSNGLRVEQPSSLRSPDVQSVLRDVALDVLVVAAYGLILPQPVLDWPRLGCLNIHASLLPRWRGAAPIARAIEAGDTVTGITIMRMDAGLDTGPMIRQEPIPIAADETAGTLHDRLARLGARLIVDTLQASDGRPGGLGSTPQPATGVTYAAKIDRTERRVDWSATAVAIDRKVRALSPAPGATAVWRGAPFRIVAATVVGEAVGDRAPGTVVSVTGAGIDVACGNGSTIRLTGLQPAGGRAMTAAAFAAGRGVGPGALLDRDAAGDA
jgi:methionyl-tRNA formyltransferase